MATTKQITAVQSIYKQLGKDISYEEASKMSQEEINAVFKEAKEKGTKSFDEARDEMKKEDEAITNEGVDATVTEPKVVVRTPEQVRALETAAPTTALEAQPQAVIDHAQTAAKALTGVLDSKPKKVMIGGQQYLEYEDWQTLGRFYGISAGTVSTKEIIRNGKLVGFEAQAEALHNGVRVSAAEASCTWEEPNWKTKPEFQLKSMAQTRACAKALRNVLGWVAVLAGYKPTPAEEMRGSMQKNGNGSPFPATPAQRRKIFAIAKEAGMVDDDMKAWVKNYFDLDSFTQLTVTLASKAISLLQKRLDSLNKEVVEPNEVKV